MTTLYCPMARIVGLSLSFLMLMSTRPAQAQQVDDPFDAANRLLAPATKTNRPAKQPPPTADRIDFDVSVKPTRARRGETVKLTIAGMPRPGFHTYPMTQRADNPIQDVAQLSQLKFEPMQGFQP